MSIRDKLATLEKEELMDIIEIQLEEIKAYKEKIRLINLQNSPYNISVSFNKNKPKPFDI